MKQLELDLYTHEEAREDVLSKNLTGFEASIKKWESIREVLEELIAETRKGCGLCIEYKKNCSRCPLGRVNGECTGDDSVFRWMEKTLITSRDVAEEIRTAIEELSVTP